MFASKSLPEHLLRGIGGLGALATAAWAAPLHPWLALAALPLAFVLLRGCPSCWLVGLVQTVVPRLRNAGACSAGSCAGRPASKR